MKTTPRETSLKLPQWTVFTCDKRFRILVAGRRFGKTYLTLVELIRAAWGPGRIAWYVGPSQKMAKRIAWAALKKMTRGYWNGKPNETDLRIELICGGTICVKGADNYDALRGDGLDLVVLDEYASIAREVWPEVLRPSLADRQGRALFTGTPKGYTHFHELVESAEGQSDWGTFQFTTAEGCNVPAAELESASKELDERVFRQEFEAKFETLGVGRAYYAFDRVHNVKNIAYRRRYDLSWSMDFNMNPMCSVLAQCSDGVMVILEELILPDSNTLEACEELLRRTAKWTAGGFRLNIHVYGDATGEQNRTSASRTDWQIVKEFFGRYPDRFEARYHLPRANPLVKDRVNCVNAMLRSHAGEQRLLVNAGCKELIKDFEQVCWKTDPHGNPLVGLNKSDPKRTHVSDAVGYLIAREFPMQAVRGERSGPAIL